VRTFNTLLEHNSSQLLLANISIQENFKQDVHPKNATLPMNPKTEKTKKTGSKKEEEKKLKLLSNEMATAREFRVRITDSALCYT